jgi:ABC-type dipeptide/oligopeptide/nickel transport system ATPase subunit
MGIKNGYFCRFLEDTDLMTPLMNTSAELCQQTSAILAGLPPEEIFFEQSPLSPDELEPYKVIAEQLNKSEWRQLNLEGRKKLLELSLRFIPDRHKMFVLPVGLKTQILQARTRFREKISTDFPDAISFYRKSDYLFSHTILNNLFFGKLKAEHPQIQVTINEQIIQLLIEENLLETILRIGMQFQVGTRGDRLSGGQRQKLAIARALLKDPKILIMDEATTALDNQSQARIQKILDTQCKGNTALIAVVHRLDIIKQYDKIAVMRSGKIEELGSYRELIDRKGILFELVGEKK